MKSRFIPLLWVLLFTGRVLAGEISPPSPTQFALDLQAFMDQLQPTLDKLASTKGDGAKIGRRSHAFSAVALRSAALAELTPSQKLAAWEFIHLLRRATNRRYAKPSAERLASLNDFLAKARTASNPELGKQAAKRLQTMLSRICVADAPARFALGDELRQIQDMQKLCWGVLSDHMDALLQALFRGKTAVGGNDVAEAREGTGVPYRIRDPSQLEQPAAENEFVRVKGCRVAFKNKRKLSEDFPFVQELSEQQLDAWLIDEFCFIGKNQLLLNGIRNSPIPVADDLASEADRKTGYRPPYYGRAAVLTVRDPRAGRRPVMVDVKGIGQGNMLDIKAQRMLFEQAQGRPAALDQLHVRDHSDGLMSLGETVAELTRQQAAQRLFDEHNARQGSSFQTVESYFILVLPFSILKDHGQQIPAALYGRQAHFGRSSGYPAPQTAYIDPYGGLQSDLLHVVAVDFGGVLITDPRLAASFGVDEGGNAKNPQQSKPWRYGHEAAAAFARPVDPDHGAVHRHLDEMLAPVPAPESPNSKDRILEFDEFLWNQLAH